MHEAEAWYALACAQVGAAAALRLLEAFGNPSAVFAATSREWALRARLSARGCERLVDAVNRDLAGELARLDRLGIRLLTLRDADYPPRLRAIPDPPCVLFVKGTLPAPEQGVIAIVGSRRASPYGRHVAAELANALAQRGFAIASGMALGADAAAHEGCLRAGGLTVAVLGSGVDVVYPPEHVELYERIAAAGAVISENPPGAPPTKTSFPIRNRIISGLSIGVVVVEAPEKSGALITADHALEQGREVFAVPGSVNSVQSRGAHRLLREGARLVESVEDILEELNLQAPAPKRKAAPLAGPSWDLAGADAPSSAPPRAPVSPTIDEEPAEKAPPSRRPRQSAPAPPPANLPALTAEETTLLSLLSNTARHVDEIIEASRLSPAVVNAGLLTLELKGLVQRRPGNQYIRL
ncbi:MAG: DNA-processing protein DprA [Armatimonadota bacterium]